MLDQEQSDNSLSNTGNADTPIVSEETFLEQQLNDLLIELNQDTQDEYFNCQEEFNTLTEEYILSTSCKNIHGYFHNMGTSYIIYITKLPHG